MENQMGNWKLIDKNGDWEGDFIGVLNHEKLLLHVMNQNNVIVKTFNLQHFQSWESIPFPENSEEESSSSMF